MNMIKTYNQFVNENGGSFYNTFLTQYKFIASHTDGFQKEFYEKMVKDAKPVKITPLNEVFTEDEIKIIKQRVRPKKKQCYKNAYHMCSETGFDDILYCEGFMSTFGIPIEHAFNKVGDVYVDITMELALKESPSNTEYIVLGEYDENVALRAMAVEGYYGNVYRQMFLNTHEKEI